MPSFKKVLFAGNDFFHLSLSLFEDFPGFFSLFFLGNDLGSQNIFLFFQSFALFVHGVNQEILFLLDFLKIRDIIFSCEGFDFGDGNIGLELDVVSLDFMVVTHEIFKLFLSFCNFTFEDVHLLSFGVVDLIDLVEFLFRFDTKTLCNVEIIVGLFVVHLIGGELLLGGVKTNTNFLFTFLDVFLLYFGLLKLKFERFFLFKELLIEELLHGGIQRVIGSEVFKIVLVFGSGHEEMRVSYKI